MKSSLRYLSYFGLAITGLAPLLVYLGRLSLETYYPIMTASMVLWFATAIFWIKPDSHRE